MDLPASFKDLSVSKGHPDISKNIFRKNFRSLFPVSAEHTADAGNEFSDAERLNNIIICTDIQPHNNICFLVAGSKKKHRTVTKFFNPFTDIVSCAVRQQNIQDIQTDFTLSGIYRCLLYIFHPYDRKA